MTPLLNALGIVTAEMTRTLHFHREPGFGVLDNSEEAPA
jgi:hypothetical protein